MITPKFDNFSGIDNCRPWAEHSKSRAAPGMPFTIPLVTAMNVDIDDAGVIHTRPGLASVHGGACHSLAVFGELCLFRQADKLYRMTRTGAITQLAMNLPVAPMAYAAAYGGVFMSDGVGCYFTDGETFGRWGMEVPALPLAAHHPAGDLPAGTYQYTVVFVRNDGEESGAQRAGSLTITSGGIDFVDIPVPADPDVPVVALYVSLPDSEALYKMIEVPAGVTTATLTSLEGAGRSLETQFVTAPPPGYFVEEHNGRLLVASGRFLYYSEAYRPDHFDPLRRVYAFESDITMVASVSTGVFLGTIDEVLYLDGADLEAVSSTNIAEYGVKAFSARSFDAALLGDAGVPGKAVAFSTPQGKCVGMANGNFINMTIDRYRPQQPEAAGAAFVREGANNRYLAFFP